MAEFVSAIVGLIAVGTHVGHKAYRVVAAFKDAQDEFLALSNEITDFRLVLNTVERALADDRIPRVTLAEVDLAEVVRQSHDTFDQVSALLAKLQRQDATEPDVNRRRWAASARKAHTLQKKIRGHKLLLSSISQANTSEMTMQIALSVEQMRAQNDLLAREQAMIRDELAAVSAGMSETRDDLSRDISEHARRVSRPLDWLVDRSIEAGAVGATISPPGHVSRLTLAVAPGSADSCRSRCACRCHWPVFAGLGMSRFLGRLLMGYAGAGRRSHPCTEQRCQQHAGSASFQLHYIFPGWFARSVAYVHSAVWLTGIPLYIRITTTAARQEPAAIFDAVKTRNIELTMSLLLDGAASIYDASSYGWGLLHYASFYTWAAGGGCDMSMVKSLLDAGVDRNQEDNQGYKPMELIVDDVLVSSSIAGRRVGDFSSDALSGVRAAFGLSPGDMDASYRDCKGLCHLHEVMLGICERHPALSDCLAEGEITRDAIGVADRRGRTAVTWAAEFGWADALRLFLDAGADPSQPGPAVCGFQPLLTLVISSPAAQRGDGPALETIRLLIRAGADVNARDGSGRAVVHMAAAKRNIQVLRILEQLGGDGVRWRVLTPRGESVVDIARLVQASGEFIAMLERLFAAEVGREAGDRS